MTITAMLSRLPRHPITFSAAEDDLQYLRTMQLDKFKRPLEMPALERRNSPRTPFEAVRPPMRSAKVQMLKVMLAERWKTFTSFKPYVGPVPV
ncbi:unnamed protein product [Cylicostephanus goldi]|uniref:Uncharacterized protein n=1 Tax=Cylicostephanus goldi TaxID=71465 RepID=A0A3P7MXC8_CYLGO|nr:unnamed protein product [Cylicostephanus goldi]